MAQAAQIHVRLTPRAAREQIAAGEGDGYLVRVTAPPVGGRANEALCRLIARRAGVAPSRVTLVRGAKSREKPNCWNVTLCTTLPSFRNVTVRSAAMNALGCASWK